MDNNYELILINIAGKDRPGLTSALTEILGKYDASILDIGQADIHHTLSLGILFKTTSQESGNIMKELLFKAGEMNVSIRFSPITIEAYNEWVARQGKHRWIITILGRRITARQIAGAMARRIVTYAEEGDEANIDNHMGFIKFGSRVDLFLPLNAEVMVKLGDKTWGGLTPLAKLKGKMQ